MGRLTISQLPHHIAIIMDGNGRWANQRNLPRIAGHRAGVKRLRKIVEHTANLQIPVLTVYAFSRENWGRPDKEIQLLYELFTHALHTELDTLHENNIRLCFIGEREGFPAELCHAIEQAERQTATNTRLILNVAANYGGRWDIVQAIQKLLDDPSVWQGKTNKISEQQIAKGLSLANHPDPDLFIRSGGEYRISNYLLWQLAYTELYFVDLLWPDFDTMAFDTALKWFSTRQRRFGRISEQLDDGKGLHAK